MNDLNDYELLYYYQINKELVIKVLRERYRPFSYKIVNSCIANARFCRKYFDELIDEADYCIIDSIDCFQESNGCSFSTFHYTCAYRKVKTLLKHYLREANASNLYAIRLNKGLKDIPDLNYIDICQDHSLCDPALLIHYKDGIKKVSEIIKTLSSLERKAWAVFQKDYSYEKASLKLGVSKKKYDNIIQKIKRKIKFELKNEY
ncbi:MAG: hypothetical protein ACK5KQ_04250 [Anaerorhabdus sp.]